MYAGYESYMSWRWCVGIVIIHIFWYREWLKVVCMRDMYNKGQGVAQDYKEAVKLFRVAAAKGDALAQGKLGNMYLDGHGVPQDNVRAYMWMNLATALASSAKIREPTSQLRDLIAKEMTTAQIERAQTMARACQQSNFKLCD